MADKDYFAMLPKLDEAKNHIQRDQSGAWKTVPRTFLPNLITSLESGKAIGDIDNIDSIPDIWARPLLFKMALFDIGTAKEFVQGLHDRVVGEWRALLAMLALKDVKQVNLKTLPVDLLNDETELAKVFKSLIPRESFSGDNDAWLTDIYIIFYNDFPIAMTSPATLVVSAADYSSTFRKKLNLPWSEDGSVLTDPIKHLSKAELNDLNFWLNNLYGNLQTVSKQAGENETALDLLKCIDLYRKDVATALGGAVNNAAVTLQSSGLNFHMGTARLLDNTVQGRAINVDDSHVKLLVDTSRSNKKLILVSPQMAISFAQQEGVDPAHLFIWSGVSANDVTDAALQGDRNKIGKINLNGVEFRRPEDFFYDQMAVVEPGEAFPGALEVAGAMTLADDNLTPILPIKRELVELFTPQEVIQRVSLSADADHFLLHFNFPLSGVDGGGAEYKFTKKYSKRELIYIQQEVPIIEIWPNIRLDNWNKYYLYYENYQAQATNKGESDLIEDMYYIEPWAYGKELDRDYPAQGLQNRLTAKLDGYPEALICNCKMTGYAAAAREVGMILLDTPKPVQRQPGLEWKIGVDFGTSSTMLYFSEGKKKPAPLNLEPRLFQISKSGGARAQTFLSFIASNPPERPDGSFLSVFHVLNPRSIDEGLRPLQDGNVLTKINKDMLEPFMNRIETNLKWKSEPIDRIKVAAYVHQICLQALVEAVAHGVDKVYWNFSYPTAFSQEQKLAFIATCRDGIEDAYHNSGFNVDTNNDIDTWAESKASAYYFNRMDSRGVNFTNGAICIDIGAGTTDISIISGLPGRIIYHTSVQYAGRYLFKPIYDNYELFTGKDIGTRPYNSEQGDIFIDADMRKHSDKYIKDLAFKTGQQAVKDVLQGSQFATAGLFYYIGQILGVLHEAEHYEENNLPDVFVGGNGSRIFDWITGGVKASDNPYLNVLEKMLADASGLPKEGKFRLNLSRYPKIEVASGMITDRPSNDTTFFNEEQIHKDLFQEYANDEFICNSVLAGGEFLEGKKTMGATSFISAHDMRKGVRVKQLDEFKKFLQCFNEAPKLWSDGIPFDKESANEIIRSSNSFFSAWKGEEEKKIFLEPIFIVELKALMEMLNYND